MCVGDFELGDEALCVLRLCHPQTFTREFAGPGLRGLAVAGFLVSQPRPVNIDTNRTEKILVQEFGLSKVDPRLSDGGCGFKTVEERKAEANTGEPAPSEIVTGDACQIVGLYLHSSLGQDVDRRQVTGLTNTDGLPPCTDAVLELQEIRAAGDAGLDEGIQDCDVYCRLTSKAPDGIDLLLWLEADRVFEGEVRDLQILVRPNRIGAELKDLDLGTKQIESGCPPCLSQKLCLFEVPSRARGPGG